jgi:hypothetical protein
MISDEELLIVLRRQITFDKEEKAAAIEWYFAVNCLATCITQTEVLVQQGEAFPLRGCYRPVMGFQEAETPILLDNQHIKMVRFSALCTGRLYPGIQSVPGGMYNTSGACSLC